MVYSTGDVIWRRLIDNGLQYRRRDMEEIIDYGLQYRRRDMEEID